MDYENYEQETATFKATPANLEAERAVLGSILIDADAIHRLGPRLQPGDFFRERHGWLFAAMQHLDAQREPLDLVTITNELEKRGQLADIGGIEALTDITATTPSAAYVEHYAGIVERASTMRKLIAAAGKIAELAYGDADAQEVIDRAEQMIFSVADRNIKRDLERLGGVMSATVDAIDARSSSDNPPGLMTGLRDLDAILGGIQGGDLVIVAARPGMGKSSLMMTMARNMARAGARSAVFSLEMSNDQLAQRLLSMETSINSRSLRMGEVSENEWAVVMEAANELSQTEIYIDDTPAISATEIRAKARRMATRRGLDVIFVDYMQLMRGPKSESRHVEISQISHSLKALAKELDVPVVALSQLNRGVESRSDKRPMLSDLRESGSIEEDADVVAFIYREDYYVEDTDRQNIADVIVAKHRHGATGTASLYFDKSVTRFRDGEFSRVELA